jgi:hypothetical protein
MPPAPTQQTNRPSAYRPQSASCLRAAAFVVATYWLVLPTPFRASGQDIVPPASNDVGNTTGDGADSGAASASVPGPVTAPSPNAGSQIQYVGPDTYILLDSDGRPQPVPGMTYEDFMAAWKQLQKVAEPNRRPRFSIENIQMDGAVRGRHAELKFDATVHLLTNEPVDVPLGLAGAILEGKAQFRRGESNAKAAADVERPARQEPYLEYDADRGGFVVRLSGNASERHTVSLKLLVPLSRDGAGTTLSVSAPRAVSSQLVLAVDSAITDVNVTGGALTGEEPVPTGTRITVAGVTGPLRLSWRPMEANVDEYATVLSSEGAMRVSIDGRSVRTDARLTVRSFGGSFDRFRVRLPLGAQLIQGTLPTEAEENRDYRVSVEESPISGANADSEQAQIVLVEFPGMQQGPVTIDLSTEQPIGLDDGLAAELAGFEVLGAVRQYGDLALQVAGDWQARWDLGRYVRQVDPSEIDPQLQQADLTAAFQYDRQPWSLRARIAARQFRVLVTPKYELECSADEARLAVHFTYQVLGARAFEFRVNLAGWELTADPVESGGLVDREQMVVMKDGVLLLPLAQGSSRRAEITFSVRRAMPRQGGRIRLPLPVPVADSVGTGELAVNSSPDINLLPDLANSVGLMPTAVAEPADPPANESGPAYRFRTTAPEAVFAADRVSRTREVVTRTATQINFEPPGVRVEQRVDYIVRYEPIKELTFEVPAELAPGEEQFEVSVGSQSDSEEFAAEPVELPVSFASPMDATDAVDGSDGRGTRRMRAVLPNPRLGRFSVQIQYRPRLADVAPDGAWRLPIVRPFDGRIDAQRAILTAPLGVSVALDSKTGGGSWKSAAPIQATNPGSTYEFIADGSETYLPVVISTMDFNTPSATVVERVWLQSWFSGATRQDRAAFRLRTTGSQVTVELPPQIPSAEIEVLLDGRAAEVISRDGGRIVARLPRAANQAAFRSADPAPHTLELRYRRPSRGSLITRHGLTPPQVVGTTALSGLYWQIVLPGDQHVVRSPNQMTSASQWQWLGSFWGRRPIRSQAELEEWVGASTQLPATGMQNEYLFTSLAPLSSIELVTAPRWLVVLVSSAVALLLVLAWIYLPVLQRRQIAVAVAVVLAGLAVTFPVPALLLAQASILGIVLAGVATLVSRLVSRPTRWPVVLSGGSSLRQPTPRVASIVMPPVAAGASTMPTILQQVGPESE